MTAEDEKLVSLLTKAADEMRAENQNGWPVICDSAASAISRLSAELQELRAALSASADLPSNAITCPDCFGAGRHSDESQCPTCVGNGWVIGAAERQPSQATETLELIANIAEGSTTANSLPHIAKLARAALKPETVK